MAAAVALTAAMCGCSGGKPAAGDGRPVVIATIFPAYDFARQVFGDTEIGRAHV